MAKPFAYLSSKIFVKGITGEPTLKIVYPSPAENQKTVTYAIYDQGLIQVTDTATDTIAQGSTEKDINIGDYLDAQWNTKNLYPALYFLIVNITDSNGNLENTFMFPIFLAETKADVQGIFSDKTNLMYFAVIDKVTGALYHFPPETSYLPAGNRFELWAYFYDKNKDMGRLVKFDELGVIEDTGYHRGVIITTSITFNSYRDLADWLLTHSVDLPLGVADALHKEVENGDPKVIVKILLPYAWRTLLPGAYTMTTEIDEHSGKLRLKYKIFVRLGFLDNLKHLKFGAIGCALGAVGGAIITGVTAGLGAPVLAGALAGCGIGGTAGFTISITLTNADDSTSEAIVQNADYILQDVQRGKEANDKHFNDAVVFAKYLKQKYNISDEDYNKLLELLQKWHDDVNYYFDDIEKHAKAIKQLAYKCNEEKRLYAILSGFFGTLGGYLVGRKHVTIEQR